MEIVRSADGTAIALDRSGRGPPLVLVSGALSDRRAAGPLTSLVGGALNDRRAAGPLTSLLVERLSVIVYDRRGRGDSGNTEPYAVEREVEDLSAVVDAGGGEAFVFGHSSGAVLALRAVLAGVPIPRLAVYEPPFVVDDSRPPLPGDYVEHLDALVAEGRRGDAVAYFMTAGVGLPAQIVEPMRTSPVWPAFEAVAHTISYDGRIMGEDMRGRPLASDPWSSVTTPTLVIDGGASPEWQRNGARSLAEVLPDARHVTLAGQDHGPAPEVLAPLLIEFFTG